MLDEWVFYIRIYCLVSLCICSDASRIWTLEPILNFHFSWHWTGCSDTSPNFPGYDAALYSAATTYYQQQQAVKTGNTWTAGYEKTNAQMPKQKAPPKQPQLHYCDVCKISCDGPQVRFQSYSLITHWTVLKVNTCKQCCRFVGMSIFLYLHP